jgi:hypothetical protein
MFFFASHDLRKQIQVPKRPEKSRLKLKTPETEVPGVSILMGE